MPDATAGKSLPSNAPKSKVQEVINRFNKSQETTPASARNRYAALAEPEETQLSEAIQQQQLQAQQQQAQQQRQAQQQQLAQLR